MMDMKRFEYLLDLHGADFSRWAPADAAAAQPLIEADATAREKFAQARTLDNLLNAHNVGPLPETVAARLMQSLDRPAAGAINDNHAGARFAAGRWRYGGLALAACVMLFFAAPYAGHIGGNTAMPAAPVQEAALQKDEVEVFVLAMTDPFLETLADEAAQEVAVMDDSVDVDAFLEGLYAVEADAILTPQ